MATSFGQPKPKLPKGRSADDILQLYDENQSALNYHLARIKTTALTDIAIQWFDDNPLTLETMADWGRILGPYLDRTIYSINTTTAKPLASYLNFIGTLNAEQLIPDASRQPSVGYDAFREVIQRLCAETILDSTPALAVIAKGGMVDLHAFMTTMESMRKRQTSYDEYVLDNPGEYSDIPAGMMLHALVGLSFTGLWEIPANNRMYHNAWEVLGDEDLERITEDYDEEEDIIAHLTNVLPASMYDALDFYKYNDHRMSLQQKQQILGMNIAHLEFPTDFELLLDVLYYNEFGNDEATQQIFAAINPAASVLSTLVALYDSPEKVLEDLAQKPHLQDMITQANALRKRANADALIASLDM